MWKVIHSDEAAENHHIQLGSQQFVSEESIKPILHHLIGTKWETDEQRTKSQEVWIFWGFFLRLGTESNHTADLCSRYRFWRSVRALRGPKRRIFTFKWAAMTSGGCSRPVSTPLLSSSNICCDCVTGNSAGDQRERRFSSLCVFSSQNSCSFGLSVCGLKFSFCPSSPLGSFRHSLYFTLSWWLLSGVKLLLVKFQPLWVLTAS